MRGSIICLLGAVLLIGFQIGASAETVTTVVSHSGAGLQPVRLGTQTPDTAPRVQIQAATAQLQQIYSFQELQQGVYIGSQFCLACHNKQGWEQTLHARFLRRPMVQYSMIEKRGVIADYDNNGVDDFIQGVDFNQIDSVFNAYKPNAPILSVENGTYNVKIGQLKCPVTFTQAGQGGGTGQRYVVKLPVVDTATGLSDSNYFAPLQFTPGTGWGTNSPQNWYDGANNPRWGPGLTAGQLINHGGNYGATCVGCHTTGIRGLPVTPQGEQSFDGFVAVLAADDDETVFDWDGDGNLDLMNIGCEDCHGPGSAHVLGGGDPSKIVNPANIPVSAQVDICGRCHTQSASANSVYPWPYDDVHMQNFTPVNAAHGESLLDFSTFTGQLWPDEKSGHNVRPYDDYIKSPKPTYSHHQVACTDCHSPHSARQEFQIRTSVTDGDLRIATEVENNTLCLSCHATHGDFAGITPEMVAGIEEEENYDQVAKVVSAHTHHPYAPERMLGLSRCVTCHMPPMAGHGALTTPSHTFEPIAPQKTMVYQAEGGMPNACAVSCHGFRVDVFGMGVDPNPNNSVWNSQFDRNLAKELMNYYGPGGVWWDTEGEGN